MEETIRAFIAFELNEEMHSELSSLQVSLKRSNADVKWVSADSVHLTLKFLGNIDARRIKEIETMLAEVSASFSPFTLSLKEISAFPDLDCPEIIWVGIDNGANESSAIAKSLEDRCGKIGIPKENRVFQPHLTIGRVKSFKNCDKLKSLINNNSFELNSTVEIGRLTLFKSQLTSKGPIYTPIFTARMAKI